MLSWRQCLQTVIGNSKISNLDFYLLSKPCSDSSGRLEGLEFLIYLQKIEENSELCVEVFLLITVLCQV